MKTVSIALSDTDYGDFGPRTERARSLRRAVGIAEQVFYGIDARRIGVYSDRPYLLDGPSGIPVAPKNIGIWLSHRALWAALILDETETEFMILEDDAYFPHDWAPRVAAAMGSALGGWDFINLGACCTEGKEQQHFAGDLYHVEALCLHAYLVTRPALHLLLHTADRVGCEEPIDILLMRHALPKLRAYSVLPRIVEQLDHAHLAK